MKGRLYVQFNVELPDSGMLSLDQCRALEKILPRRPGSSQLSDAALQNCEETTMYDVDIEVEMRRRRLEQQQQEAYDEDEDAAPRVQCAQQ